MMHGMVSIGCFSEQIVIIILQWLFKIDNGFDTAVLESTLEKTIYLQNMTFV